MILRCNLVIAALICFSMVQAQNNFVFTPDKPKPGDAITITYTPAGNIANTLGKVEGIVYASGSNGMDANDLVLTRKGKKWTTTLQTDTSQNFIQLGFYVDKTYDNNFNEGYFIQLYDGDKVRKQSNLNLALFYRVYGRYTHVESNKDKARVAFETEFRLYPEQKKSDFYNGYLQLLGLQMKEGFLDYLQKEIEARLKEGLKTETDFSIVSFCYNQAKLPEQSKWMDSLKRVSFPHGKWKIDDWHVQFNYAKDPSEKAAMLDDLKKKVNVDPIWKPFEQSIPYFESSFLSAYANSLLSAKAKDWEAFKNRAGQISDKNTVAQIFNSVAWNLQEKDEEISIAREFSKYATEFAKADIENPVGKKPGYASAKQWRKQRESMYAMYADTYGMILYKSGDFKQGFPYATDAAQTYNKFEDADLNTTYALLAEKVMPAKEFNSTIESFIKTGTASVKVKEMLKNSYVRQKGTDTGFAEYLSALEKESDLKMLADLHKAMLNEPAPGITLLDLDGKSVSLSDLKGKIVIADFWATWCGPCLASFPSMQKLVEKYKSSDDVRFIFIDTWENGEAKEKKASEFIATNKYPFHILMDNDNKVIEQYKVNGIPTKFVIDKSGAIRFKSVGFNSDEKLINEVNAMIDLVRGEKNN